MRKFNAVFTNNKLDNQDIQPNNKMEDIPVNENILSNFFGKKEESNVESNTYIIPDVKSPRPGRFGE